MPVLQLTDNFMTATTKMARGNPGAATVLMKIYQDGRFHDPVSAQGGVLPFFALDELGIYADEIWILYKDVCFSSVGHLLLLLRAKQLGFVQGAAIKAAIAACKRPPYSSGSFDFEGLYEAVYSKLGEFHIDLDDDNNSETSEVTNHG